MSAAALFASSGGGRSASSARLLPGTVARLGTFTALALFAGLSWTRMEVPGRGGRMLLCVLLAVAVAAASEPLSRLPRRGALPARAAGVLLSLVVVLLASGVSRHLLAPSHWDTLLSGLSQGVQALPGIGVPYRGVDPWVHVVLIAGGGLLVVVAGVLAGRARRLDTRPAGAAVVLAIVYTIGVVERPPGHPALSGAVLALLGGALLWADRLESAHAAPAAIFVVAAVGLGLAAGPRLASGHPWVDYQGIVDSLSTPPAIAFDWNHGYGPLRWPRDNRVMFRVAAPHETYFKTVDLDRFDGHGWTAGDGNRRGLDSQLDASRPAWREQLRVTVADLRSPDYIGAGSTLSVERSPRYVVPSSPGTFVTGRDPLRFGDSYLTDVYTPHPSALALAKAGVDYPPYAMRTYLAMDLPPSVGGPRPAGSPSAPAPGPVRLQFLPFGSLAGPLAIDPATNAVRDGDALLRRSAYGGVYDLALRLRDQARTPIDFVRAIEQHLADGFTYTERPPTPGPGRPPLVSFLLDTRLGYCQHFSGAMALMLRMGGVPARVASGFTPGTYDAGSHEWVVRDVDAHSWVEAYFPKLGWVTFDPTPAAAPPRDQLAAVPAPPGQRQKPLRPDPRRADVPHRPASDAGAAASGSRVSVWVVLLAALAIGFGGVGAVVGVRRYRRAPGGPAVSPELAELERALRRTGRPPAPGTTLKALEERFARHAPLAAEYVASVRLVRYGGRPAGPTAAQRSALRAELAAGLGWSGRLRAWWALPPRGRRPHPL